MKKTLDRKENILPHLQDETPISLNITVDTNGGVQTKIEILKKRYFSKKKMKLFQAPLRTTYSVLITMNIKDYVVSSKPDGVFSALYIEDTGRCVFNILGYLNVVDIFSLGQVHRIFTDNCLNYMKMKPIEWKRLYTEIENNECDDITYWT